VLAEAAVVVVSSLTQMDATALDAAPRCQLLLTTTSGYDHLDLGAARARGVVVARMPMARRDAVVQAALAMALSLLRDLPAQQVAASEGHWVRAGLAERGIARIDAEPFGIVGLGVIGRRMAEVLQALGVEVWGADPLGLPADVRPATVAEMTARCRVVSLHCSHQRGAPPVLGGEELAVARPDLLVINTARGRALDLAAAEAALVAGRLGGLALDVFPREPWPHLQHLAILPRVLLSPHAAGYHDGLARAIAEELGAALAAWKAGGEVPNRVA
jgi:phosphoglycerate dehydrogenase-like enzyme